MTRKNKAEDVKKFTNLMNKILREEGGLEIIDKIINAYHRELLKEDYTPYQKTIIGIIVQHFKNLVICIRNKGTIFECVNQFQTTKTNLYDIVKEEFVNFVHEIYLGFELNIESKYLQLFSTNSDEKDRRRLTPTGGFK